MKVCETFVSIQGEINVGRFALFIRFANCNLNCSWCDTKYAFNEYINVGIDELVDQAKHFSRVILTGGEPFLQKEEVNKLVEKLIKINPDIVIEIETNGTIRPIGSLAKHQNVIFNVSIKLKNSNVDFDKRIKPSVINWFNEINANFKFVVSGEDDVDEVIIIVREYGIRKHQVFLMAEGKTREEQWERMEEVLDFAKVNGYNFSPRLQVLLYGNKRGV